MSRLLTDFPSMVSSPPLIFLQPRIFLSAPTCKPPDIFSPVLSCRTAGAGVLIAASLVPGTPLKCQLSVWRRVNLTDQSGSSSFIIHSHHIQSLQAHGHRELSSMPPLIIRLHQRLFALSNQCLYNSALPPQETTNEYFMSPLIQS